MAPTVLIVDDEPAIRNVLAWALEDEGYEVWTACNGLEALACHRHSPLDLILTDARMPVLDGDGLVSELRALGSATPVILMSATERPICYPPCIEALTKPFDLDTLFSLVSTTIGQPVS
jgi:two-component system, OmpR family, response regulator VicR